MPVPVASEKLPAMAAVERCPRLRCAWPDGSPALLPDDGRKALPVDDPLPLVLPRAECSDEKPPALPVIPAEAPSVRILIE